MRTGRFIAVALALLVAWAFFADVGRDRGAAATEPKLAGDELAHPPAAVVASAAPELSAREARAPAAAPPERGVRSSAGSSAISGVVLDPDGRPCRRASLHFAWTDRGRERAVRGSTDADGRFVLDAGDPRARGDLLARVYRHALAPAALVGCAAGTTGIELRLGSPRYFRVDVRVNDVSVAAKPRLYWLLDGQRVQDDPGGDVGGDRQMWARSPVPFVVAGVGGEWFGPFDPSRVGEVLTLGVEVEPYATLRGRVVREGTPVADARVTLERCEEAARTDAAGSFELRYRGAGSRMLRAFSREHGEGRAGPLELSGVGEREGLEVELVSPACAIDGRVRLPTGRRPEQVWLCVSGGGGYRPLRADASFSLPGLAAGLHRVRVLSGDRDRARDSESWIQMTHGPSRGPEWLDHERTYDVELAPGDRAWLEIDLTSPMACRVEGEVRLDGAAPLLRMREKRSYGAFESPSARLHRPTEDERDYAESSDELDLDGRFVLGVREPGERTLALDLWLRDADVCWSVRDRVELACGAAPWRLDVASGAVVVLPSDEDHPEWIPPRLRWKGSGELEIEARFPELDERRGSHLYPRVPAGRVRLESGELALECDVRAGETTEVRWPPAQ